MPSTSNVIERKIGPAYLAFEAGVSDVIMRARFIARIGYPPVDKLTEKGIVKLGPLGEIGEWREKDKRPTR